MRLGIRFRAFGVLAGVAQLVERHPSKVNVVGSSPIARSLIPADIAQG